MLFPLLASSLPAGRASVEASLVRRIRDAAIHVAYYRDLLAANGLKASDFNTIADCIEGFPRTPTQEYRRMMQEHGASYLIDRRFKDGAFKRIRTSGSSGIPCEFIRTRTEFAHIHAANTVSTLVSAGVRPWHRIMALLPPWSIEKEHHSLQRLGIFPRASTRASLRNSAPFSSALWPQTDIAASGDPSFPASGPDTDLK